MNIFTKNIVVTQEDLDLLHHVNNVRYVQWVQDIAEAHWFDTVKSTILDDYYWVLVSHRIDYKKQAVLGDKLILKTHIKSFTGVSSIRWVDITNATTNKQIATSETKWCLINKNTNRPTRIPTEIATLFD